MNIAFITSEAYPFAKTGGLADVAYSLPRALTRMGHDVRIFMPRYYIVDKIKFDLKLVYSPLFVPLGFGEKMAAVFESAHIPGVITYFIEYDLYFGRVGLYDNDSAEYPDNAERFTFFCRAVMQAIRELDFRPDIIHCNDWQTALVPVYRKTIYRSDPWFKDTSTIMTVHNAGYQGVYPKGNLSWTQLGWEIFTKDGLEYFDQINFLKGGILFADAVNTVSKKYSEELQTEAFGYNLASDFRKIKSRLYGITNGVEYDKWDPSKDGFIASKFSFDNMAGKAVCKRQLQRKMGIAVRPDTPLLGTITRVTYQKGMDILADVLSYLIQDEEMQFVILGAGEERIINRFNHIRSIFRERVGVFWGYDEKLAHMLEAGLDIYLMPSRYEPCGLNQMYSLKYGTIPVVHATGGLDDTIQEWDEHAGRGIGFKFNELSFETLYQKTRHAIKLFHNRKSWRALQKNAMNFSYSWDDAASEYVALYKKVRGSS